MFLICGEALYDMFLEAETPTGLRLDARMGGSPFNVAIGLARLCKRVGLFTGVSTDTFGRHIEKILSKEGVETQFLAKKRRPTTLAYVDLSRDGFDRYTFYGQATADRSVTVDDLPQIAEDCACLHFGSYSCVVESTATSFHNLAKREAGKRLVSFDPNVRLTVESDIGLWRQRVEAFAELADIIKVSEEDLGLLFPGASFETVADRWRRGGAKLVVVTRGELGAVTFLRNEVYQASGGPVPVVDTVGAGDSFVAALLCGLHELGKATRQGLDTLTIDDCRRMTDFSIQAAAITCSRRGADLPRRGELPDV